MCITPGFVWIPQRLLGELGGGRVRRLVLLTVVGSYTLTTVTSAVTDIGTLRLPTPTLSGSRKIISRCGSRAV